MARACQAAAWMVLILLATAAGVGGWCTMADEVGPPATADKVGPPAGATESAPSPESISSPTARPSIPPELAASPAGCALPTCEFPRPGVLRGPVPGSENLWSDQQLVPFSSYGPGEYTGPARSAPVVQYRLRVGDVIRFVFRLTREQIFEPYRLNVGDVLLIESVQNSELNREVVVQPDGSVTLLLIGPVPAAGRTIAQLQEDISDQYAAYYRDDVISITPKAIDTKLRDLLATVDNRQGFGGQALNVPVTPEGTVQLPAIGSVCAQGLTLDELQLEIHLRYRAIVKGLGVTPVLLERSTPYAYVLGEVNQPQRVVLERPTTVMQAIALAGGWRVGGNLRQIVIFRRTSTWELMATKIDLRGALLGKRPCPADEIWLRDSDVVLVPKTPFRRAGDIVNELFTHGANDMIVFGSAAGFLSLTSL